jgi:hypothetical protein
LSSTGNITGLNFIGSGATLTSITGANVTGTVANATYAVSAGSATSATTAGTVTTAAQPNITSVGTLSSLAVTGNTTSGNFVGTLNGSGANVTSISATNISSGTLDQLRLANASLTVNGTTIALGGSGTVTATATNALTIGTGLGGTSYNGGTAVTITNTGVTSIVAGTNISVSGATGAVTVNVTGTVPSATTAATVTTAAQPNITSVGTLTALSVGTGNVTAGNLLLSGAIVDSAQLDLQTSAANANIVLTPNGTGNVNIGRMSASGNITAAAYYGSGAGLTAIPGANVTGAVPSATSATTAGTVTTAAQGNITSVGTLTSLAVSGTLTVGSSGGLTSIVKAGTTGVGNIGAVGNVFNTVFAKATSAQYADLAEMYCADADYEPGTVLVFGGDQEVTIANVPGDTRIAGVVSTNPAHLMNSTRECHCAVALALTGRVPTMVLGPVTKGDMMVSAGYGRAMACATPALGSVIGKALEDFTGEQGTIEVVVGRL